MPATPTMTSAAKVVDHLAKDLSFLELEQHDNVLTCTINRPDLRNAIDEHVIREFTVLFSEVSVDESVDVVVITGKGEAFSAGGDIREMQGWGKPDARRWMFDLTRGLALIRNLLGVPQPVIASLNGDTMGLGATLALFCDVVLAADHVRVGDPHVRVGLAAGDGGAVIWPLLVGPNRAKEYLMTGDWLTAAEAERIGLVNHVYSADALAAETTKFATRLANGATVAIRASKLAVNKQILERLNLVLPTSLALEGFSAMTDDHLEAVNAFLEKRKPQFKGC